MDLNREIQQIRIRLLQASPFYGALLTRIPIVEDRGVATACTDGRSIRVNPRFFAARPPEERNYILMHELFHVLLSHPARLLKADRRLANIAGDIIVNDACNRLCKEKRFQRYLPLSQPVDAVCAYISSTETLENLYAKLMEDNRALIEAGVADRAILRKRYVFSLHKNNRTEIPTPASSCPARGPSVHGADDLIPLDVSPEEARALEDLIRNMVRQAYRERGKGESIYMPTALTMLTQARPLQWRRLLRDLLDETRDDEASYATPERKYLHMDLILPGHGLTEGDPGEVWAFVDSSGSIGTEALNLFLTQLYHLVRQFRCTLNLAYWDTSVTKVYPNIRSERALADCPPNSSGGTNINCVYDWMERSRIRPDILLILTDGYFGKLNPRYQKRSLRKKTLIVLSDEMGNSPDKKDIGRVAILGGK